MLDQVEGSSDIENVEISLSYSYFVAECLVAVIIDTEVDSTK